MMAQWLRALTALSRDLVQSQHSHDSSQVGPKMHGKTSVHIKKKKIQMVVLVLKIELKV